MAVVARPRRSLNLGSALRYVVLTLVVLYLVLPLFSTILFSLATVWSKTILPEGYTLNAYRESLNDPQILRGIQRSLTATVATLFVGLALVVPALLWVHLRAPKFKRWLEFLAIVPWALPGVVLALAVIRTLSAVDLRTLVEAAQTLGAGWFEIGRRIILPNIAAGMLSASLLVAALASGEYVIARLLGGTGWKTFALYQAEAQFTDGRVAAALAVLGFAFTWLVSMGLIVLSTRRGMASPVMNK
jgi:putative spermidine/putrescine transport system permease protein